MASSFGPTTIRVRRESGDRLPLPRAEDFGRTDHVPNAPPGGDITQVTGTGSEVVTYQLNLTDAEYAALKAQRQTEAVLTVAGVAMGTWLLERIGTAAGKVGGWVDVEVTFCEVTP